MIEIQLGLSLILSPLLSVLILIAFKFKERTVARISYASTSASLIGTIFILFHLFVMDKIPYEFDLIDFNILGHHFPINFYLDKLSFIFLFLVQFLSVMVIKFSHTYMHKEKKYQVYFRIMNLFIFGLNLLSVSGTLDLFFAAWEIIGLSSFLLISFYSERTRAVRNGFRVLCIYRFCDFGILFAALVGHYLIKDANHFQILLNSQLVISPENVRMYEVLGALVLLASMGKSAQFPFHNWPARAMEGPTPSSAIFYGALAIHCGAILMYRTYNIWHELNTIVFLVVFVGVLTVVFSSTTSRVQSTIKGRLAYLSVAQIGFMYIEIALGWHNLFLYHLCAHCILRSVQILTSPSSVVDHIKTLNEFEKPGIKRSIEKKFPLKLKTTLFSFAFQENCISPTVRGFFPIPGILIRQKFKSLMSIRYVGFLSILPCVVIFKIGGVNSYLSWAYALAVFDVYFSFKALSVSKNPKKVWHFFCLSQLFFFGSVLLLCPNDHSGVLLYSLSSIPAIGVGYFVLTGLEHLDLNKFNGLASRFPLRSIGFFWVFLIVSCFPFSTTFIGEHLIFLEILKINPIFLIFISLSFFLNGIVTANIFVKIFWGFPDVIEY